MSSSSTAKAVGWLATIVKYARAGFSLLKLGSSPITATAQGFLATARWFVYTTAGRVVLVLIIGTGIYALANQHFTARERAQQKSRVETRNIETIDKVGKINAETAAEQKITTHVVKTLDKILSIVISGIWRTEKPDPVESETIDLINEVRGTKGKPSGTPSQ
jgi:hypothetical protein